MVMVAPNGARKTKADHPNIPILAEEMAVEAKACVAAGAAALHVHVRDEEQRHVLDAILYQNMTSALKESVLGSILQITTEAVGRYTPQEQMACVRAVRPEAVSIALKELIPDSASEDDAKAFLSELEGDGCSVQFICYDADDVERFFDLRARGVVPQSKPFLLFVLGRYAKDQQSEPEDLDPFLAALNGRDVRWAMCAFGAKECACALYAANNGGHVRIGFENNMLLPDGTLAPGNAALIETTVKALADNGHSVMSAQEARVYLGMS